LFWDRIEEGSNPLRGGKGQRFIPHIEKRKRKDLLLRGGPEEKKKMHIIEGKSLED